MYVCMSVCLCVCVCVYVCIYCKWTQVRWQNYIDINNIQINRKHQQ
jgi:hypothetical protein